MRVDRAREPYEDVEVGLGGTAYGMTPAYTMNDNEILEWQAEHAARLARSVPLGFRAGCAAGRPGAGGFPNVPRFDIVPTEGE